MTQERLDHAGNQSAEIAQFFEDFDAAARAEDWSRYRDLFLPQFMNIDPGQTGAIYRDALIAFLPQRKSLFERAGASGTALTSLDVDSLDAHHAVARTAWEVLFNQPRDPVILRTTFLLRKEEERWQIAVYVSHQGLLELLDPQAP